MNRVESFKLVDQAIKLRLAGNDGDLSEVEKCLRMALELDPGSLVALQEAAHFYDAVLADHERARDYATACRDRAARIVSEMEQILAGERSRRDSHSKGPAGRHIGGIIGPY